MHFTWTTLIPFFPQEAYYIFYTFLAVSLLYFLGRQAKKALAANSSLRFLNLSAPLEVFIESIDALSSSVIGPKGKPMLPFFCWLFLFVWLQNLIGLVPGFLPPTENVNTTVALGAFTFLYYNYWGFKEHGLAYLKQFLGPVLFMAPLFVFIEILSHIFRSLSLGLRLFGNMKGDHVVIGMFLEMVPYFVPIIFYFLGFFVCTLQAFVFTILSMVYVSLAISHDH